MGRGCHLVFITFTRLFFRSGSNLDPAIANETAWRIATEMVNQMGTAWNANVGDIILAYDKVFALFALGMVIHWLPDNWKRRYRIWFARMPLPLMAAVVVLTVFIAYQSSRRKCNRSSISNSKKGRLSLSHPSDAMRTWGHTALRYCQNDNPHPARFRHLYPEAEAFGNIRFSPRGEKTVCHPFRTYTFKKPNEKP